MPGTYTVKLTVNGKSYTQPLTVRMDPRVKATPRALLRQYGLSQQLAHALKQDYDALQEVRVLRAKVREARGKVPPGAAADGLAEFDHKLGALEGGGDGGVGSGGGAAIFGGRTGGAEPSLGRLNDELGALFGDLQSVDAEPTTQEVTAIAQKERALRGALARWSALRTTELSALNTRLRAGGYGDVR